MQEEAVVTTRSGEIELHLEAGEIVNVQDGPGLQVKCVSGVLWITQADDTNDIVLHDGESFVLDRPGLALVSAISPTNVAVRAMNGGRRPFTVSLGLRAAA